MEKKLLIFDVDGTVWDSEKDVFLSFNHTLKTLAGFEISKEEFQKLAGMHLGAMFEKVLPEDKKSLAGEYEKAYKKYYIDEEHYADATELFPNVKKMIDKFKSEGYYMAVASSKPKRILDKMMSKFDLNGFDYVLGTEESDDDFIREVEIKEDEIEEQFADMKEKADKIRNGIFEREPKDVGDCASCPYRSFCKPNQFAEKLYEDFSL